MGCIAAEVHWECSEICSMVVSSSWLGLGDVLMGLDIGRDRPHGDRAAYVKYGVFKSLRYKF